MELELLFVVVPFSGFLACLVSCFVIGLVIFERTPLREYFAFSGALAASVVELFTPVIGIDDNLTIPLAASIAYSLAARRLGIQLPLF